jgi:hypothetical protein
MGTMTDLGGNMQFPTNTCGGGIQVRDPLLVAELSPALNIVTLGGVTPTHALSLSSKAINAGVTDGCPATDQRGVARPQGDKCDSGAFELEGSAPGGFTLNAPANGAGISSLVFTWSPAHGVIEYKFTITNNKNVKIVKVKLTPEQAACGTECTYTAAGNFKVGRMYTWRVVAKNSFGKVKSEKRTFTLTQAMQPEAQPIALPESSLSGTSRQ